MIFDKKIAIEVVKLLLKVKAIQLKKQNYFTWSSGMKSPIYCDNRVVLGFPNERDLIQQCLVQLIQTKFPEVNALSGVATAGIGIGALLAGQLHLPYSYVRSAAKAHGKQNQIEGYIHQKAKIVVIEDLISTGGSTLKAVEALQQNKHQVIGAVAIFTYGFQKATDAFKKADIPFYTLGDYEHLIELMEQDNQLDSTSKTRLLEWRQNPESWS